MENICLRKLSISDYLFINYFIIYIVNQEQTQKRLFKKSL